MKTFFLVLVVLFLVFALSAQNNFKAEFKKSNPVDISLDLPIDSVVAIHKTFLQSAKKAKDTLNQLYANFFLYVDFYKKDDYAMVQKYFLDASNLVNESSNPAWKAAISMRKAHLAELVDDDLKTAVEEYKKAVAYCKVAKDSFCIAESLEQLSNLNSSMGNYDLAQKYFDEAIIMMRQFAGKAEMALTYNNYSILLSNQGRYKESVTYLDSAITLAVQNKDLYKEMMYRSNLASKYTQMGMPQKAIPIYQNCIKVNTENQWYDHLLYNYAGIADAYEAIGNLGKTNEYTHNYYILNDSIKGAEVKLKIAKLESENENNKTEILLEKSAREVELIAGQKERLFWFMLVVSIVAVVVSCFLYRAKQQNKKERQQHQNYLADITNVILKKNLFISQQDSEILELKKKSQDSTAIDLVVTPDIEDKIFNTRILNEEDYQTFKSYFEKAYPGYLVRLRRTFQEITPAEERLFLLIKLNLKSNDIAEILGISSASVKKTRNRLRKKLNISEEVELESFIDEF